MAQERMYTRLNTEQDIVHKMDFTYIVDFIQEKTGLRPKKIGFGLDLAQETGDG